MSKFGKGIRTLRSGSIVGKKKPKKVPKNRRNK
jgi:hypothetical protein